jgi:hypothetical protein
VPDQLSRFFLGAGKSHPLHNVIQPPLKKLQQVITGDPLHPLGLLKVAPELTLQNTIDAADLLFLTQLDTVFRLLDPPLAMLTRWIASPDDPAFIGITPLRLQKQFRAFPSAELAD